MDNDVIFRARMWRLNPEYEMYRLREKVLWSIAQRLPRWIRYYATVQSCAEATMGKWSGDNPHDVNIMAMLGRIDPQKKEGV